MTSAAADNAQRPLTPDNEMAPSGGRITDLGWICALYELGQKAANGAHPQQVRQDNAVSRQKAVGDVENEQRLSYTSKVGPIEARNAGMRVAAETPGLVSRAEAMLDAGVGADARAVKRLQAQVHNQLHQGPGGHWFSMNPQTGEAFDTGIVGKDPMLGIAERATATDWKQWQDEHPGLKFDFFTNFAENVKKMRAAMPTETQTAAPAIKPGGPQPSSARIVNPNGAPTGPPGTAGRPGVGDGAKQTLSSYLATLPPSKVNNPEFLKYIAAQRLKGMKDDDIILSLKRDQLKSQALMEQRRQALQQAMGGSLNGE